MLRGLPWVSAGLASEAVPSATGINSNTSSYSWCSSGTSTNSASEVSRSTNDMQFRTNATVVMYYLDRQII